MIVFSGVTAVKQRVATGKTLFFAPLDDPQALREKLSQLPRDFTGEITGVVAAEKGGEEEFAVLVSKGEIILSVLEDKPVDPRTLLRKLVNRKGYIEVVKYTPEELEIELRYRFTGIPGSAEKVKLESLIAEIPVEEREEAEAETRPEEKRVPAKPVAEKKPPETVVEEAQPVRVPVKERITEIRGSIEEFLRIDNGLVGKTSENLSRAYHKILMVLREKSSTIKRLRGARPEDVVREAAKLAETGYTGIHVRTKTGHEALLVLTREQLCLALERSPARGIRVLDEEAVSELLSGGEEEIEYILFPIEAKHLEEILAECARGEKREGREKKKGLMDRFLGLLSPGR